MNRVTVCALVAAGAMLVPAGAQARTRHVRCGETITTDTTLAADVTNCPDEGIVIGADGITLDLNGHTVGGDGAPVPSCPDTAFCDVGIDATAGHSGVTIENGLVKGFDAGVWLRGDHGRIEAISTADEDGVGVAVQDSTGASVSSVAADGGVVGIFAGDSRAVRLVHDSVTHTTGYAIPLFDTDAVLVDGNTLRDDEHGILLTEGGHGVFTRNRVTRTGSGIGIGSASDNLVAGNVMTDGGDAVGLTNTTRTLVAHNRMSGLGFRFPDTGGFGVLLDGGDHDVVRDNVMSHSHGPLIYVTQIESAQLPADDVIEHNVADDGLIGIDVDFPGNVVSRNEADFNTRLGIQAVPGTIDGGGNRARGNGDPRQCTVIACH